jgi:ABC-type polysaccharide/polyol phosphate transport system ATPase subunit
MSADPLVSAAGLSKSYDLALSFGRETMPQTLQRMVTGAFRRRVHWALRDVNFEIGRGEIVGLIGPNGAGKSTLLLLLAGIAAPTEGTVTVRGRADLFFQLGSALSPRLTVLDNLHLCAALLGHDRALTRARVDRILEFSGLSDYRDQLFGVLSSGMAARLPFSVALHGDLEIVLSDEAVSVGDAAFQARCAEAFGTLRKAGKTIVLATHSLTAVRSFCTRVIYLDEGRVRLDGSPAQALAAYLPAGGA